MSAVRTVQVTFDCADPARLATFWAAALGYEFPDPPGGFATWDEALDAWGVPEDERNRASAIEDPSGAGPRIFFQQVPEGKTVKNRLHLDVRAAPGLQGDERMAALTAECERLLTHGATQHHVSPPDPPMSGGFIVMQDPEGNEFCLD